MAPSSPPWTLLLGPGSRLADLRPVLAAIADDRLGPKAPRVRATDDLLECLSEEAPTGRVILDTDAIRSEDLGLVRRFLATRPGWEVMLTGVEEGSRSARGLLAPGSAHWRTWPLDVEQLAALVLTPAATQDKVEAAPSPPRAGVEAAAAPEPHSPALGRFELAELEQDLEAIEHILARQEHGEGDELGDEDDEPDGFEDGGERLDPRGLDLTPEEIEAFLGPDDLDTGGPAQAVSRRPAP